MAASWRRQRHIMAAAWPKSLCSFGGEMSKISGQQLKHVQNGGGESLA